MYGFFNILLDFSRACGSWEGYSDIFVALNVLLTTLKVLL
jgi:hypothetical protein